jgi:hypothetical protein
MLKRWLSGFLIFVFGFGCASLVTVATARENLSAGSLEEGLGYVNDERDVTLINSGKNVYVVMVHREPSTSPADAPVSYNGGTLKFSKYSLDKAIAYRLVPIAILEEEFWRPCSMGDCSWQGPLPPQPDPLPGHLAAKFLSPE